MIKSNQIVTKIFVTTDPTTGGSANADSLPVGALYINGALNAADVAINNIATGVYSATVTLPILSPGDGVNLTITATIGAVTGTGVIWEDTVDTKYISDLNDLSAADPVTLTPAERTAIANEVESQIINDTDSERVLQAIVDKIASANPSLEDLTLLSIASAVRSELTTELSRIDQAISTRLAALDYVAPPIDYAKETTLDNLVLTVNASQNDLVLINKWILNRLDKQDNSDGTYNLVLYDDDNITVLKTWMVNPTTGIKTKAI
jgi:hypothetical protein